jgi:hypothetical protein
MRDPELGRLQQVHDRREEMFEGREEGVSFDRALHEGQEEL